MMMMGIATVNRQALNAWRANTGGNTSYGNIQAGRNVNEFIDWIKSMPDADAERILLSAVQRRCP
jgi:hypothetical protein